MCSDADADGCFLIRAYKKTLESHGHATAVLRAARLYRRTNTEATLEDAIAFVSRFVAPEPKRPAVCLGGQQVSDAVMA